MPLLRYYCYCYHYNYIIIITIINIIIIILQEHNKYINNLSYVTL